jgi:hypothetical protein
VTVKQILPFRRRPQMDRKCSTEQVLIDLAFASPLLANSGTLRGGKMDESKRQAVQFLEKEIKTYIALALFLSKKGIKEKLQIGDKEVVISHTYYNERMKEARKIVNELRKPG